MSVKSILPIAAGILAGGVLILMFLLPPKFFMVVWVLCMAGILCGMVNMMVSDLIKEKKW